MRTIYNPYTSSLDPPPDASCARRSPATSVPVVDVRSRRAARCCGHSAAEPGGNVDNWQGSVDRESRLLELLAARGHERHRRRQDVRARTATSRPISTSRTRSVRAGFFPLSGSNRDGMSLAGDAVWVMSKNTTLNVRGSYYNMVDEFYNPSLLLGEEGLGRLLVEQLVLVALQQRLRLLPCARRHVGNRHEHEQPARTQGREWYQHPDAWTLSARMNRYQGRHNMKWGGEVRAYYGEAARFEPINLVFNSALTANSSDTPEVANSGNQWATFLLGALDNQTSARLVPLQTPNLRGYSAYFQDDWRINDRLTLNLGLRWEYEPGATDPDNRLSQGLDLTQPIPGDAGDAARDAVVSRQLMASKGYSWIYNGAWQFTTDGQPARVGQHGLEELHAALRRELAARRQRGAAIRLRTLPDADRATSATRWATSSTSTPGYAQTTHTLGLFNGVPQQTLAGSVPVGNNPVRSRRAGPRALHGARRRRQLRSVRAAAADQRSLQPVLPEGNLGRDGPRCSLLLQLRDARSVHSEPEHGAIRPSVRDRARPERAGRQPFQQLPDAGEVPGTAAQQRHRHARQPARAVSAVRRDHTDQPNGGRTMTDAQLRSASAAAVHPGRQLPRRLRVPARQHPELARRHRAVPGDDHQRGRAGNGSQPTCVPEHRLTAAVTWQIPVGTGSRVPLPTCRCLLDSSSAVAVHRPRCGTTRAAGALHEHQRRQRQPDAGQSRRATSGSTRASSPRSLRSRRAATRSSTTG